MTYVIAEPCVDVMDQSCVSVCPVDCIHFEEGVDRILYIDPDECIDCGACVPECPVEAIFEEGAVPPEEEEWLAINEERARKLPVVNTKQEPLTTAEKKARELGFRT